MSVVMKKSGSRDCEVHEDAVPNFEKEGWRRAENVPETAGGNADGDNGGGDDGGLSDDEKQAEIDARCKQVAADGEAKGLDDAEIDADVEAERARVTAELG